MGLLQALGRFAEVACLSDCRASLAMTEGVAFGSR